MVLEHLWHLWARKAREREKEEKEERKGDLRVGKNRLAQCYSL